MSRVIHFLRAESKTLAGIFVLLAIVVWVWTQTPTPKSRPPTHNTVAPGDHLADIKVGTPAPEVLSRFGKPARKNPLPLPGAEAWLYPDQALQVDVAQGAVMAVHAKALDGPIEGADDLAAQGLLMDPSLKVHPNLTAMNGKISDWMRLEKALKLENPRQFKFGKLSWRVFPGLVLVLYNDDPKQKPKLAEVIVTAAPRVPEAWAKRR